MGDGVYLQSRQSADLFNVAHFRAKTKTTPILMRKLQMTVHWLHTLLKRLRK